MRCPKCSFSDTKVVDTRSGKNHSGIRRRRECLECGYRFSTTEEVLGEELVVVKRDGEREDFDLAKLRLGVRRATNKRPITTHQIDALVSRVIEAIQRECDTEVPSALIGELIMEGLKEIDQIAYVRFASVYKDFRDIAELEQEIQSLKLI